MGSVCLRPIVDGWSTGMTTGNSLVLWAISTAAYLLPGLAGIYRRRHLGIDLQILLLYVLLTATVNFLITLLKIYHASIDTIMLAWSPLQYGFLMIVLHRWVSLRSVRRAIVASIVLLWLVALGGTWISSDIRMLGVLLRIIASLFLSIGSSIVIFRALRDTRLNATTSPAIWVAAGVLVYFSGDFVLTTIGFLLKEVLSIMILPAWVPFQSLLNIIFSGLLSMAFLQSRPSRLET
ncbi:MAG: hypothetical protein FJ215_01465 [Ignavibacteria bacterium]|nr:hypothetical protein [Ignavibacteria bacterium]